LGKDKEEDFENNDVQVEEKGKFLKFGSGKFSLFN